MTEHGASTWYFFFIGGKIIGSNWIMAESYLNPRNRSPRYRRSPQWIIEGLGLILHRIRKLLLECLKYYERDLCAVEIWQLLYPMQSVSADSFPPEMSLMERWSGNPQVSGSTFPRYFLRSDFPASKLSDLTILMGIIHASLRFRNIPAFRTRGISIGQVRCGWFMKSRICPTPNKVRIWSGHWVNISEQCWNPDRWSS